MPHTLLERLIAARRLTTPPRVVLRFLDLARRYDVSVQEVSDTIALDPGLAAKILRFVNSPMAGVAREVTSLKQAVSLMGMRGVKMMALSFSILSSTRQSRCPGFDQDHFSMYSLGCAVGAKTLATTTQTVSPQDAFSAGLLSQMGRSVLATAIPEEYGEVLSQAKRIPFDLPLLEKAKFGETYATIGEQILRAWGIPEPLCQAIGGFRSLDDKPDASAMAKILYVAERAADVLCPTPKGETPDSSPFIESALRLLGVAEQECVGMVCAAATEVENMRAILEMPKGALRSTEEIEGEVRERIAELSLAMHMENQCMAQQQEELLRRATTDALTRVGNRAAFDSRLALEMERAVRSGEPLALMMIDVDKFKLFNDTHGHQAGDIVLQNVARALDGNVRKVDYVARYGGEEFAVIAPNTPVEPAVQLAERLRRAIEALAIPWEGKTLRANVSIGIALAADPAGAADAAKLIRAADEQLYAAKCGGRNQVRLAGQGLVAAANS